MRTSLCSSLCMLGAAAVLGAAAPALAGRPTCEEILAARDTGQSVEQVAESLGTTRARVEGCKRIAQQRQRFAEERVNFYLRRAERGLDN